MYWETSVFAAKKDVSVFCNSWCKEPLRFKQEPEFESPQLCSSGIAVREPGSRGDPEEQAGRWAALSRRTRVLSSVDARAPVMLGS